MVASDALVIKTFINFLKSVSPAGIHPTLMLYGYQTFGWTVTLQIIDKAKVLCSPFFYSECFTFICTVMPCCMLQT